ncbi:hypothetical protein AYO47_03450 [Planctomyces sp. SCGC AG-212-M04]|nr:hypothetical protein AYO47_03450 [Planctomyces sp. SCGC AG-212-M04]
MIVSLVAECLVGLSICLGVQQSKPAEPKSGQATADSQIPTQTHISAQTLIIKAAEAEPEAIGWKTLALFGTVTAGVATLVLNLLSERRQATSAIVEAAEVLNSSPSGAGPIDHGSVLFCLTRLGEPRLALNLLDGLVQQNRISPASAVCVINEILRIRSRFHRTAWYWSRPERQNIREYAAMALRRHAARLPLSDGDHEWPAHIEWKWDPSLSDYAQRTCLLAAAEMLLSKPRKQWNQDALHGVLETIDAARRAHVYPRVRCRAAHLEKALLTHWNEDPIHFDREQVGLDDLRQSLDSQIREFERDKECALSKSLQATIDRLTRWSDGTDVETESHWASP